MTGPAGTRRPFYSRETSYVGHRFRSRLEARWAVFFDHAPLWVPWRYEAEGIVLPGGRSYLPDYQADPFAIEVKGSDQYFDVEKSELFVRATGRPLLVLGDIPRPDDEGLHLNWACIPASGGALWQLWRWWHAADARAVVPQGFDWPHEAPTLTGDVPHAVAGVRRLDMDEQPEVDAAYTAARSARFEFGENGAPRRPT